MISVIIPALNEEKTVGQVVQLALNTTGVTEVIVVDDKSLDNTVEEAKRAGATVITSTKLGKGASMKDGVLCAGNEVLVFLDADITTYPEDVITVLANPLLEDKADFCKSYFSRQAGRVTELVAKPLLSILYPDFPSFVQPLSGMIAGRKSLLRKLDFEEGYGVDIGILIDMYQSGGRINEVCIGHIENKMQPLEQLGKMSREVAAVILKKSKNSGENNYETLEHIQLIREQMEFAIRETSRKLRKVAIFDMDNTLLRASFIHTAANEFGFKKELLDIQTTQSNPFIRTKQIARLLKGRDFSELIRLADAIPVTGFIQQIIKALKENGFVVGLVSDSYDCITNHFKNKFGFDFSLGNELEFSKSVATGEVKIPSFYLSHDHSACTHEYCKTHALTHICKRFDVPLSDTLAIGDSENDICIIKKSGIGVSFCSTNSLLDAVADFIIKEPDFELLLPIIE
ncbi:MAG TPA: HAD-IB family phosphatase [Chitinophagaceae bacterium]|nr:HAD-IB family phosphatase [Chitinophagaceae bacterium]